MTLMVRGNIHFSWGIFVQGSVSGDELKFMHRLLEGII